MNIKKFINNLVLEGSCSFDISSGHKMLGEMDNIIFSDFNVKKLSYDSECQCVSVTFTRFYPIIGVDSNEVFQNHEFSGETIEVMITYCLCKNSIISASIYLLPGQLLSNLCLVTPLNLSFE